MPSGFSAERAAPHDAELQQIFNILEDRGYEPAMLPVDGHRPDMFLDQCGDYLDVKTGGPNLTIEINSINEYRSIQALEKKSVYIVHIYDNERWVLTLDMLRPVQGHAYTGPNRATRNGSNDNWFLFEPGHRCGTRFDDYFKPPRYST